LCGEQKLAIASLCLTASNSSQRFESLQEDQQVFMQSLDGLSAAEMENVVKSKSFHTEHAMESSEGYHGEWLPLSVWVARGFDGDRISTHTPQCDRSDDALLGQLFRVRVKTDKVEEKKSKSAKASISHSGKSGASGSGQKQLALEDGKVSNTSSDNSESSGSSSSSSAKKKKKDKKKKHAKKDKKDKKDKKKKSKKDKKNNSKRSRDGDEEDPCRVCKHMIMLACNRCEHVLAIAHNDCEHVLAIACSSDLEASTRRAWHDCCSTLA